MSYKLLEVEDLFKLEQIESYFGREYSFSPDGRTLAYVLQRAKTTTKNHKQDFLVGNDRADIWLADLTTFKSFNLTQGLKEDVGYWSPTWSPDGKWLAMLSTKGDNITLWVWNRLTGNFQQLVRQGVAWQNLRDCPYSWISNSEIVVTVLPKNEKPWFMTVERDAAQKAWQGSQAANLGKEVTVSVLQSGVAPDLTQRIQKLTIKVDLACKTTTTLIKGNTQDHILSPNRDWLAYLETVEIARPQANKPIYFESAQKYAVKIIQIQNCSLKTIEVSRDVLAGSLCWSLDGKKLAFIAYEADRICPPQIYIYNCHQDTVRVWQSQKLNATPSIDNRPGLFWTAKGKLLVYAAQTRTAQPSSSDRYDWWLLDCKGEQSCLTADLKTAPQKLFAEADNNSFIGLAEGNLWRIEVDRNSLTNLTAELEAKIGAVIYPENCSANTGFQTIAIEQKLERFLVKAEFKEQTEFYQIDLRQGSWQRIEKAVEKSQVVAYEPRTNTIISLANNDTGTYLWCDRNFQSNCLLETNTFLREIKPGILHQIEYKSLDGENLRAQLILPPDYDSKCTYPLIAWIYPGWMVKPTPDASYELNFYSPFNLQLAAAQGYIVIEPSIPLKPKGEADDPMLKLLNGVLPAVERAIQCGLADPSRLFLMGHSFGGYGVYGLIAQTNRFNAAVSLAGVANLVSMYGSFDPRRRYREDVHESFTHSAIVESGQIAMGSPPWQDLGRYLRNSPIFAVDRIETPLTIVQGDLDYVPIQQGEELFVSLHRQGKRVEFLRYWGEGHVLSSPANIKDMWQRIFTWFEEFSSNKTQ